MTTDRDLVQWATREIEAAADGSLDHGDRKRFDEAIRNDPGLRAAVQRARQMQRSLGQLQAEPVPPSLLWQLLRIPARNAGRNRSAASWQRLAMPVAAIAVIVGAAVLTLRQTPPPEPSEVAIQEFLVAMTYLQQSTVIAHAKVQSQVGSGFLEAMSVSRDSLLGDSTNTEIENGG